MKRLLAWGSVFALAACQLVAGITDVSSNGPCTTSADCPANESCFEAHCRSKGTTGGTSAGGKAGAGGTGGTAAAGGHKTTGGSSGSGGMSATGGASGMSQAGAAAQSGAGGRGGASSGGSGSGDAGDAGDGAGGEVTGTGGVGGANRGGTGGGGAGAGGGAGLAGGGAGMAAGGMAGTGGGAGMAAGGMAGTGGGGPVRIMPLGDGITAGTCMRAFLWKKLSDNAYPAFDFVGSRTSSDMCLPTDYDKHSEGHAGYRVSDLLATTSQHTDPGGDPYTGSSADLAAWFDGRPADLVLMLFGSNDLLSTSSTAADIQNAYSAILAKLRSVNARVTLLVGLLPPMSSSKCNTSCASRLSELNAALPGWAAAASTATSRVVVVDLNTGFDVAHTTDGIKPDDTGAQFLADRWYAALVAL